MPLIYIQENKDVLKHFLEKNITLSPEIRQRIGFISNKTANNYVGYYQFLWQGDYYKVLVVPKTISENDPDKEQKFISFLGEYYRLSGVYKFKNEEIRGNIGDFTFDEYTRSTGSRIDNFIRYKYEYALDTLDAFFRKHSKTRLSEKMYSEQSIRHRIDLKRNITCLDKATVFQVKKESQFYSHIALISAHVLRQFKIDKLKHLAEYQTILTRKTNTVLNRIYKRYAAAKGFDFKDRDIVTHRIAKLFKRNKELRQVYDALLILIGLEHFKGNEPTGEVQKLKDMVALFFNPADVYEWVVYDQLKQAYPKAVLKKAGLDSGTTKTYRLVSGVTTYEKDSKPDFILIEPEFVIIIDAKWKVLAHIAKINFDDIAKLERDWQIRLTDYPGKAVRATLVYPEVAFNYSTENPFRHDYAPGFAFEVKEVKV